MLHEFFEAAMLEMLSDIIAYVNVTGVLRSEAIVYVNVTWVVRTCHVENI
jgi:hypothetical protein